MIEIIETISTLLKTYSSEFATYSKEYPIVAGSISLWALGLLASLRTYPQSLWALIVKQSTTSVTITSSQEIFHKFSQWYELNNFSKNSRSIKLNNGAYGEDDNVTKAIGYGSHIFWHKFRPIKITVTQSETNSNRERDQLVMTSIGRNHKFFDVIIKEANNVKKEDFLNIFTYENSYWENVGSQRHRKIDSIYIRKEVKKELISHIDNFKNNKEWYVDKCLPYQTGILLSGPPGTGKTSIIKAIASHYNYELHTLKSSRLISIENAFHRLPKKCLVVIEDIDSDSVTHKRSSMKVNSEPAPPVSSSHDDKEEDMKQITFSSISDVLNAIDGLVESDDRILIMTTNHPEKLDEALIRPGRIDLKLELGYADEDILKQFMDSFYEKYELESSFEIKDYISPAHIQQLILKNLNNPEIVIDELRR